MLYTTLKLLHIFLAIVAVGFNISYGIWIARAARDPEHELFALRGIKTLDDRFANPAYTFLLVTGVAMVFVGKLGLTTFWILAALILWLLLLGIGAGFYTPTLRKQIAALEQSGRSPEYLALSSRGRVLGIVLGVLTLAILYLMVFKPTL